jgi:CheY-like chemotaxis protein
MASGPAILLVEDNAFDAKVFRYALEEAGIDIPVSVAKDGIEALNLLKGLPAGNGANLVLMADFDVIVVTDLNMPRMGGIDLLRKLRSTAAFAHVPVFVMTTSDLPKDHSDALGLGIESYIRKTGEEQDLVSPIVAYLARHDGLKP